MWKVLKKDASMLSTGNISSEFLSKLNSLKIFNRIPFANWDALPREHYDSHGLEAQSLFY